MVIVKNYSVWYQYKNMFGILSNDRLRFDSEEDADKFIKDLLEDEYKRVLSVEKMIQTTYYPEAERK